MIKKKLIDFINSDRYIIINKIIFNLNQIFAKFDREFKIKIELLNSKFVMKILDLKEIFFMFYI